MFSMNASTDFERDAMEMSMSLSSMSLLDMSGIQDLEWDDDDDDDDGLEPISISNNKTQRASDPNQQQQPQRKSVDFAEYVEMELIETLSEMSEEDKAASYYDRRELDTIKQRERRLCKEQIVQSNKSPQPGTSPATLDDQVSTRGLEVFLPHRIRAVKQKVNSVHQVSRCVDPMRLAQLAEQSSEQDRRSAMTTALHDFYDAYFEPNNTMTSAATQQQKMDMMNAICSQATSPSLYPFPANVNTTSRSRH